MWDFDWRREANEDWLCNIVRHMRNSVAHGRIEPVGDDSVTGFRFWDERKNSDGETVRYWGLELGINGIRRLANDLVDSIP